MQTAMLPYEERSVHVRFQGQSWTLAWTVLNLREPVTPKDVRQALARYFDVAVRQFEPYVIEQHANGNITVRPEAVFG